MSALLFLRLIKSYYVVSALAAKLVVMAMTLALIHATRKVTRKHVQWDNGCPRARVSVSPGGFERWLWINKTVTWMSENLNLQGPPPIFLWESWQPEVLISVLWNIKSGFDNHLLTEVFLSSVCSSTSTGSSRVGHHMSATAFSLQTSA